MALFSTLATGYGLQKWLKDMTRQEASVGRLSKAIGDMSVKDLSVFEQASERMGGSAEAAGQSILGLSQAITDMSVTANPELAQSFQAMGIALSDPVTNAARKTKDILLDLQKWFAAHQGPLAQNMGKRLGFDQGLINLLSSPDFAAQIARVEQIGVPNEADAAKGQEFIQNLHDLQQIVEQFARTIGNDYLPMVNKSIESMNNWLIANREWLKADIEEKINKIIPAIKEFWGEVQKAVDAIGGWKTATEIVFGLWVLSKVAPIVTAIGSITTAMIGLTAATGGSSTAFGELLNVIKLASVAALLLLSGDTPGGGKQQPKISDPEMEERIKKYNLEHPDNPIESFSGMLSRMWQGTRRFLGMPSGATDERMSGVRDQLSQRLGISQPAASGLVSNLNAESGIQGINETNPTVPGSRGGFGWAQWTGPRRDEFEAYAARHNIDPASDEANMGFLVEELTMKYPQILAQLRRGDISAYEAANIVARGYIIPPSDKVEGHIADAERINKIPPGGDFMTKPSMKFGQPSSFDPGLSDLLRTPTAAATTANDNSRTTSNSSQTTIGAINIQTQQGDPDTIAKGINASLRKYAFASPANFGLA
jgi:hypothetical protein